MASADRHSSGFGPGRIIVMVTMAGALLLLAQCVRQPPSGSLDDMLKSRELPADVDMDYDWTVKGLDGQDLDLAETRGKVVFINLWATWCPPCRAEMPSIQRLYDKVRDEGAVFILLSDERPDTVREFVEAEGYSMPIYTSSGPRPSVLDTKGIPTTFIISPQGKVVLRYMGAAHWDSQAAVDFLNRVKGGGSSGEAAHG